MEALTKDNLLKFLDFSVAKGLVNSNTGTGRKAACSRILEAFGPDDDLEHVDIESEVLKYNNRHPGQLSPESLSAYQRRVEAALEEFRKYVASPTTYKGVPSRPPMGLVLKPPEKRRFAGGGLAMLDTAPAPIPEPSFPQQRVPVSASTDTSLVMPFPLRPTFLAQIVIPRDLTKDEAVRLCAFIQALAQADPQAPK